MPHSFILPTQRRAHTHRCPPSLATLSRHPLPLATLSHISALSPSRHAHPRLTVLTLRMVPPDEYHDSLYIRSHVGLLKEQTSSMESGRFEEESPEDQWATLHSMQKVGIDLACSATLPHVPRYRPALSPFLQSTPSAPLSLPCSSSLMMMMMRRPRTCCTRAAGAG